MWAIFDSAAVARGGWKIRYPYIADPPDGYFHKADTLAELAKKVMGHPHQKMPLKYLEETVARYNALADKGVDEDFEKPVLHRIDTPPFYAATAGDSGARFLWRSSDQREGPGPRHPRRGHPRPLRRRRGERRWFAARHRPSLGPRLHRRDERGPGAIGLSVMPMRDTMAAKAVRTHGRRTCTVEVSPREVDAGAELTVTVRVSCPDGCDLRGQSVSIRNQDDTELASAELTEFDGETCATSTFVLRAPLEVGEHIYRAVLAAQEKDGVLHEETATEFSFAAKPHATSVNVWGLPSAIAAGERFRFKVGIKCSAGCKLTGRPLSVFDDEGAQVGAASLRDDVWPGTSALYFAEVEAQAPLATGDHEWQRRDSRIGARCASCGRLIHLRGQGRQPARS